MIPFATMRIFKPSPKRQSHGSTSGLPLSVCGSYYNIMLNSFGPAPHWLRETTGTAAWLFAFVLLAVLAFSSGCGKKGDGKSDGTGSTERRAPETSESRDVPARNFHRPVLTRSNPDQGAGTLSVKLVTDNIRYQLKGSEDFEVTPDSLASRIKPDGRKILWNPNWIYHGIGGVRIPACAFSPDKSVFAVLENFGGPDGPYGSHIILFETSGWHILQIYRLPDKKAIALDFSGNGKRIALHAEKQPGLKMPPSIILMNITSGDLVQERQIPEKELRSMLMHRRRIFFTAQNEDSVYAIDINVPESGLTSYNCGISGGHLSLDKPGNELAVSGPGKTVVLDPETGSPVREIKTPAEYVPEHVFSIREGYVFSAAGKETTVFRKGIKRILSQAGGKVVALFRNRNELLVSHGIRDEISLFRLPDLSEIVRFEPARTKPQTRGGSVVYAAFLEDHGKYALLDDKGNFYLYWQPGKKWRKELIFEPEK